MFYFPDARQTRPSTVAGAVIQAAKLPWTSLLLTRETMSSIQERSTSKTSHLYGMRCPGWTNHTPMSLSLPILASHFTWRNIASSAFGVARTLKTKMMATTKDVCVLMFTLNIIDCDVQDPEVLFFRWIYFEWSRNVSRWVMVAL